jgi:lipid A 3-O-deacylase
MSSSFALRLLICLAVTGAWPAAGQAGGLLRELRGGVLAHDVPNMWSGFRTENDAVAINVEAIFSPSLPFLGGTLRPAIGASIATEGGTSNVYLDARWEFETATGVFFSIGAGGTVHDGETKLLSFDQTDKALGSRVLLHFPVEIGYRFDGHNSVSVYFEHMSNGYTRNENEGLDRLGVRYGYRF